MKKIGMVFIFLVILLIGCQNQDAADVTWGSKHSISIEDISRVDLQMGDGTVITLPQEEMVRYLDAISSGIFDKGQLDIRPADYAAELTLKNGNKRGLSVWISDGSNLFMDHEDPGHYILDEKAKATMMEIVNEKEER